MTLRRIILFILLLVVPAGLVSAQTNTPAPTPTNTFTYTPSPTYTLTPSSTPTPSRSGLIPVGAIMLYGGDPSTQVPPTSWLICDGHAVYRSQFPLLFTIIGTTYGVGDGSTTFNLPDFRGRVPLGGGAGLGLTARTVGNTLGNETHTLTITEMPPHHHGIGRGNNSGSGILSYTSQQQGSYLNFTQSEDTGGGAAFNIMNPSLVVSYYIFSGEDLPTSPDIEITVVLVFPSHTPTSTNTPTLTATAGPSPTNTSTPTATPLGEIGYQVGDQTVLILNQVTPGDLVIVGFLVVVSGLLITILFFLIRRRS